VAERHDVPVILMHSRGDPGTMQDDPRYDDVLLDVYDALEGRVAACVSAGIPLERLVVDPGIGFGKTLDHNLRLMRHIGLFHGLGCPVLLGISRKSTIGRLSGGAAAEDRLPGSLAAALWGVAQGVQVLRVHDVGETVQALKVWMALDRLTGPEQDSINGLNGI
jgi:dihydropteroate synthase